jgi:cytochrome o ubiquinol oxidase subunit 2
MIKRIPNGVPRLSGRRLLGNAGVALLAMTLLLLNACHSGAASPKGPIAAAELHLMIFSIKLMLLVVIPVIVMACFFAWRYREGMNSKYTPEWTDSTMLELIWWSIPIIIIMILGTVTWVTTHSLDPYKPIDSDKKSVTVEVVSLDWKWLFIYPELKIATVNYLKLPAGTPINFKITAASPMNSFIIPQLGGQIYAMTGMTTKLHLLADIPGIYRGLATNYTGIGFAGMHFDTVVTTPEEFINWVETVKQTSTNLTSAVFWDLLMPKSIDDPAGYFGSVEDGLFDNIIMHYMMPGHDSQKA